MIHSEIRTESKTSEDGDTEVNTNQSFGRVVLYRVLAFLTAFFILSLTFAAFVMITNQDKAIKATRDRVAAFEKNITQKYPNLLKGRKTGRTAQNYEWIAESLQNASDDSRNTINSLQNKTETFITLSDEALQTLGNVTNKIGEINNQTADLEDKVQEKIHQKVSDASKIVAENKNVTAALKEKTVVLKEETSKLTNATTKLKKIDEPLVELEESLEEVFDKMVSDLKKSINENKDFISSLKNDLTDFDEGNETLRKEFDDASNTVDELDGKVTDKEAEILDKYKEEEDEVKEDITGCNTTVQEVEDKLSAISEANDLRKNTIEKSSNLTKDVNNLRFPPMCLGGFIFENYCVHLAYISHRNGTTHSEAKDICRDGLADIKSNDMYTEVYNYIRAEWIFYPDDTVFHGWLGSTFEPGNTGNQTTLSSGSKVTLSNWHPSYPDSDSSKTKMVIMVREDGDSSTDHGLQNRLPSENAFIPVCGREL